MPRSISEYANEINTLTDGFIEPVFERRCPQTGRLLQAGLNQEDFERVRLGYGCPECLVRFRTYLVRCPVCGHRRDLARDIIDDPAPEWVDHMKTRSLAEQGLLPKDPQPSMHSLLDEIARDPEVEQVPVRKLRPRLPRWKAKE